MKYLKESKDLHLEQVKEALTISINWQMIEDVKDMSLEYLDMSDLLSIFIYFETVDKNKYTKYLNLYISFGCSLFME